MNRQQRRAINRANAALSTGPVSQAGKQTSSANSTTHGLTSLKPYRPAEEADYRAFEQTQLRIFDPQNDAERDLAQTIIDVKWRLKRISTLEACLYEEIETDAHRAARSLDILGRYENRLRKILKEAVLELQERTHDRRKNQETEGLSAKQNSVGFVLQDQEALDAEKPKPSSEDSLEALQSEERLAPTAAGA